MSLKKFSLVISYWSKLKTSFNKALTIDPDKSEKVARFQVAVSFWLKPQSGPYVCYNNSEGRVFEKELQCGPEPVHQHQ